MVGAVFEGLLDPIPGPAPAGESLRWGPIHAAIEEARREEADLPQGVWERPVKRADPDTTIALCREALATRSKDLQCAAWLVEAATRRDGPAAAATGLDFIAALCGAWWETLFPEHDGDADSPRLATLAWLDGALALALATWPVAVAETEMGPTALSWSDHAAAARRDAARRGAKAARPARTWLTVAQFEAVAEATPRPRLDATLAGAEAVMATAAALEAQLAALAGPECPGFSRVRGAARDLADLVRPILLRRPTTDVPVPPDRADAANAETAAMSQTAAPGPVAPLATGPADREAAYRALADIAAFLRRTEPHSLTPYLVDKAVRWGTMSAQEVLADLARHGRDPDMLKWLLEG